MAAFTWTKDQASGQPEQEEGVENENHVSNRKFVVEGEEELIKGGAEDQAAAGGRQQEEVVT